MDGERIDAEAVEAWRPPVADAATDVTPDIAEEERMWASGDFNQMTDVINRRLRRWLDEVDNDDALDFVADPAEPDDLDLDEIDDCDPADDEPDFVRDWVDED